jgi:hypothetical protein
MNKEIEDIEDARLKMVALTEEAEVTGLIT